MHRDFTLSLVLTSLIRCGCRRGPGSESDTIELRKQLTTGAWQQFNLTTGQSMGTGSPARASASNADAIEALLLQIDGTGHETIIGSYRLLPGASVDVSAVAGKQVVRATFGSTCLPATFT